MLNINKKNTVVFGLSTSKNIAKKISTKLDIELGIMKKTEFADGEIFIESSTSVRNKSVFIIQSTHKPANDNLMELLLAIDALKRSSSGEINVIIPYFGYARQDRKVNGRQAISAKLVADLLVKAGINRMITFDIHSEQIVGFFDVPVDNLKASGILGREIKKLNLENLTIVSPDHGGVSRARTLAKMFDAPLVVIDKRRASHNKAEAMFILGDVENRNIVIFDDMVDTGGTVASSIKVLKDKGAKKIYLAISHPVLSGTSENPNKAIETLKDSGLEMIITTNSIKQKKDDFIKQIDLSDIISETISNHINGRSITDHFIKKYNTNL